MQNVIWMRVGDGDSYHEFHTPEEVAEYLANFYQVQHIERSCQHLGVTATGYTGRNYIYLYWGTPDPGDGSAKAIRELTDEEISEVNESLDSCKDCGYFSD